MSLTLNQCRQVAWDHLSTALNDVILYQEPVHSGEYGWVFSYQRKKYSQTGDISEALCGNSPLLVDKNTHELHVLGTALPVEFYVESYLSCGDPFKVLGASVELLSWREGAQKNAAIREIRRDTKLSLAEAKLAVDSCLSGHSYLIKCVSERDAGDLVECLRTLGFVAIQLHE
jgi:hypothetical protein